ncbi:MAG: uL30 family ribosomal protein [Candidatus Aenigmatarchaeota archaeon]
MMYAAVRIRGEVGVNKELEDTLKMLNLNKKFSCTLLPETEDYEGMLKKVKSFVAWGQVDKEVTEEILEKKSVEEAEEVVEALEEGESLSKIGAKRSFPLSPPSGGFSKSTKKLYPKGEAGKRDDINKLLERMI